MSTPEKEMTFGEAVKEAIAEEIRRDPTVFLMGEDVGKAGTVFKVLTGLHDEFGDDRIIDTPIAEAGLVGLGVGAALTGSRPIVDVMFGDFITLAMDQIVNQAAKLRYMSGGQATVPITIRTTMGAGRSSAAQHSQSLHAWLAHIPGLKVVAPSTPADAKGLLTASIRDDDPVIFCEHKFMYDNQGAVPEGEYIVPLGQADIKREGADVTIVAISRMVDLAHVAAEQLDKEGVSAEIVDPRTLIPLDQDTILNSLRKTGRLVVVDEDNPRCSVATDLATLAATQAIEYLCAPVKLVTSPHTPVPFSPTLEDTYIPTPERIIAAVRETMMY